MKGGQLDGYLTARAVPIAGLVRSLTQMLGRPVSDQTGLKGVYDFKLQITPDDRLQPPPVRPQILGFRARCAPNFQASATSSRSQCPLFVRRSSGATWPEAGIRKGAGRSRRD
jgi:uncharacterized protein (TIGR03435 family)